LVVWLSLDAIPEISTKLLAYKPDNLANGIIEKGSSDTVFYLTEPLRTENSIDKNLPEALVILLDFHLEVRNKIMQYDKRILDISALHPNVKSQVFNGKQRAFFEISNWLWVVFIVFFIVERGIAKYRKQ